MRILFGYRYGILGGVCTQLLNRLAAFADQGDVEVHLAFKRDLGISAALEGYPHVLYAKDPKQLVRYCKRNEIDVISVIDTPEMLEVAQRMMRKRTVLLEVHTTYTEGLRYLDAGAPAHAVLVPSRYSERLVRSRLGVQVPLHRVGNCIDAAAFRPTEGPIPEAPILLWVGKLDGHKNWRGFLALAAAVRAQRPAVRLWMVGGATAPEDVKQAFAAEVGHLGLGQVLRWFDSTPYTGMPALYQQVARSGGLAVSTSRDESFGMSTAEAILCGCRVVAADVGALRELDQGDGAIRFYPLDDVDAAVDLIVRAVAEGAPATETMMHRHEALARMVAPSATSAAFRAVVDHVRRS
jgi:glycosyltransferase involved in cell wall biosynthesis